MSLSCHNNYISTGSLGLLEALRDVSAKYPAHGMYYINNSADIANPTFSSYPSLLAQAYAIGERLRPLAEGMSKRVVVLYFDDHQDTIEHYWGCLAAGFVPCVLGALRGDDDKRTKLKRINSGGEANLVDLGQQLIRTLTEANIGFTGVIAPGFGTTETFHSMTNYHVGSRESDMRWLSRSLLKCGRNYEPSGTVEHVSVFYAIPLAGKKEDWLNGMLMKWDGFTRQANSYTDVPGAHYTLMNHHYVPYFQKHLKAELKKAGI
ncbi:hypothetical protein K493DRAFT_296369 [Basidiobolus meristosporus CBS 931.73]|uniref:Uncharacterized protein n=1 Tax=Basidiobolus meristosporus CBS 931.73 TaxID=1314790 RepID=A0A1Y1Z5X7_9FUNG|nr:hypothetical protein K493DRAFT_296369 [Basidiobolus meristosporus CBS 931.73]|eukprot:ORY05616.1 hypothetical protein K493DRAFT_296369 [Basidiobolus meristosporus CBS 931.73]